MDRQEEIKKASYKYCDPFCNPQPTGDLAFRKGAMWADKTMIEKACKWFDENITNDHTKGLMTKYGRCVTHSELLQEFKQAMEE